jgi:hypothetical protein
MCDGACSLGAVRSSNLYHAFGPAIDTAISPSTATTTVAPGGLFTELEGLEYNPLAEMHGWTKQCKPPTDAVSMHAQYVLTRLRGQIRARRQRYCGCGGGRRRGCDDGMARPHRRQVSHYWWRWIAFSHRRRSQNLGPSLPACVCVVSGSAPTPRRPRRPFPSSRPLPGVSI